MIETSHLSRKISQKIKKNSINCVNPLTQWVIKTIIYDNFYIKSMIINILVYKVIISIKMVSINKQ